MHLGMCWPTKCSRQGERKRLWSGAAESHVARLQTNRLVAGAVGDWLVTTL